MKKRIAFSHFHLSFLISPHHLTMSDQNWFLLKALLSQMEQLDLFIFVNQHDASDWGNLSTCMNPTPKTLDLVQQNGTSAPTLNLNPNHKNVVLDSVKKAFDTMQWSVSIKSVSMAVIRYCPAGTSQKIGSCFPCHIDHCNDGSWVVLLSLGCNTIFQIKSPDMKEREIIELQSGDCLVFDPSSNAEILHGVDGVFEVNKSNERWTECGKKFEVLCGSRFGVQCRVSLVRTTCNNYASSKPIPQGDAR